MFGVTVVILWDVSLIRNKVFVSCKKKSKNKRKALRDIFIDHFLFIHSCIFVYKQALKQHKRLQHGCFCANIAEY